MLGKINSQKFGGMHMSNHKNSLPRKSNTSFAKTPNVSTSHTAKGNIGACHNLTDTPRPPASLSTLGLP